MRRYPVRSKNVVLSCGLTVKCFSQAYSCVIGLVLSGVLFGKGLETFEGRPT